MAKMLKQKGTGRIYSYSNKLAERDDMSEFDDRAPSKVRKKAVEVVVPDEIETPEQTEAKEKYGDILEMIDRSDEKEELIALAESLKLEVNKRLGVDKLKVEMTTMLLSS